MKFFQYFMTEEELAGHVREADFVPVETGTVADGSLALFSPELYCRLRGLPFRIANRAAATLLKPFRRYHGMIYCVAKKQG